MILRAWTVVGWALASVALAGALALVEVFWLPLRVRGVLVPLSVPAAAVGNLLLVRLAHRMSRSRVVAVLPAVTWLAIAGAASVPRPEGDLLLVGNGALGTVGLVFWLVGVVAAAFAVGGVLAQPLPPRR